MCTSGDSETSVQVAVRIRPQNTRELIDMCRICTSCTPNTPQIILGKDKAFTYDYVFDTLTTQQDLYENCVETLIRGCFDGYNATVLAYGQTGSGKTYTMGTGFDMTMLAEELGVVPQAVQEIFSGIDERRTAATERNEPLPQFEVNAQFLELYNEEIIDLFDEQNKGKLRIHEDSMGNIYVAGATDLKVSSEEETMACLKRGALSRTVGSTNMNAQSSRSHAIFTLHVVHQRPLKKRYSTEEADEDSDITISESVSPESPDWETLKAKFHFVDLAGSERLKRTGATGDRAKEGISINCGLLALGNVISALGDKMKKASHVPYRDSKLTRLLQDSLGGNSRTLMIACISPTDRDFMETLNTLKYSNRARNIKNKVVVNQDKMSQQLSTFRSRIQELELELQEFKSGRLVVSEDGSVVVNDMANEITMLRTENDKLRVRVKAMQQVVESQSCRLANLIAEKEVSTFGHQDESTGQVVASDNDHHSENKLSEVIKGYIVQIEELKSRLILSESLARLNPHSPFRRAPSSIPHTHNQRGHQSTLLSSTNTDELLKIAKENIESLKLRGKRGSSLENDAKHSDRSKGPLAIQDSVCVDVSGEEGDSSNEDSSDDTSDADTEGTLIHPLSSDDSDSDGDETESLASSVAELSSEINLKQQLVDQLEKAQNNFYSMKSQYEDKMQLLQHQIKSIESERDRVLKDIGVQRVLEKNDEKTKEIKSKYEQQLTGLRTELRSLKSARKEHAKAIIKNAQHERELGVMKIELLDMKKQRVKMMNKMRSEANQRKLDDARTTKEIRQLQKEGRKRDTKIKSLETDAQRRELVLKRRQDELSALRREKRHVPHGRPATQQSSTHSSTGSSSSSGLSVSAGPVSDGGAGYSATVTFRKHLGGTREAGGSGAFERNTSRRVSSIFSSGSARKKWRDLEKKVFNAVLRRQTMANLAKDMDMWIEKRDQLSRKIDELKKQKQLVVQSESIQNEEVSSIEEDLDSVSANIDYVQENIVELQNDLIAVDDTKSDGDTLEAHTIIASSSPREAKYLLEHFLDLVLNLGVKAAQKEAETKVLEVKLQASEQSAEIIKSFSSPQVSHTRANQYTFKKAKRSSLVTVHVRGIDPPKLDLDGDMLEDSGLPQSKSLSLEAEKESLAKSRRRNILPSVNLSSAKQNNGSDSRGSVSTRDREREMTKQPSSAREHIDGDEEESGCPQSRVGSLEQKRKGLKNRAVSSGALNTSPNAPSSCPTSPSSSHRLVKSSGSEANVWSRLSSTSNAALDSCKGLIQEEKIDPRKCAGKVLHCTHTACGHASSVLSVFATQNYLFSASQDRTVKIWNLKTCTELLTLDKHFSYVRCVHFCPKSNLIFTASQSHIKLWDMRHHRARCIKTFGPPSGSGSESAVQDLLVSPSGNTLYSASGNFINSWDLKKFMHQSRFVGHSGAVCTLTMKGNLMATGSRDRLIKLYDLEAAEVKGCVNQPSICTLYPPHYDAVSSLASHKDLLFSSCGVTIKQWDIKERSLKHAVDGAHSPGNTINSLATFNSPMMPLLVSGCKGGFVKLWNPVTCSNIGELLAHKHSINSVATNNTCIFTGSSDKTIKIWRPSPHD